MSFLPVFVPPPMPSQRAQELSGLIQRAIADYRRSHPQVNAAEVRQALHLAASGEGASKAPTVAVIVAILALLMVGLAVALFVFMSQG